MQAEELMIATYLVEVTKTARNYVEDPHEMKTRLAQGTFQRVER